MTAQQKKIALFAGGALILLLVYRWYTGQQNQTATGASTPATDTAASDYASLAGQEQGDVANLQQQEQSDFGLLQNQEQTDVGSITGALGDVTGQIGSIGAIITGLGNQINEIASGQTAINRRDTITTNKGGAFYKYYVKVTGKTPPSTVSASDLIYQAWKAGVSATSLRTLTGAKNTKTQNHAGAKNTHVAHPNSTHTPNTGQHNKPSGGAGIGAKTKPKASGARK